MKKFWIKSRTILFNLGAGLVVLLGEYVVPFKELLGDHGYQVALAVVLVANLVLRSVTTTGVTINTKGG